MYGEKRVVIFAVITTIIAFGLVYFFYFNQKRTEEIFDTISFSGKVEDKSNNEEPVAPQNTGEIHKGNNVEEIFNTDIENIQLTGDSSTEKLSLFLSSLSGLKVDNNNLDSINKLSIGYKFLLKKDNLYFAYVSSNINDIKSNIQKIGGKTVEIKDKKIIVDNYLTGDNVFFLNIPEYKNSRVLMIVYFEKQTDYWFIQIPYNEYYNAKPILRQFFSKYDE